MFFIGGILDFFKNQALYMLGRGLLGLGLAYVAMPLFVGSVSAGALGGVFAFLAVGATAILQGVITWNKQSQFEQRLIQDYGDELAAKVGVDPKRVTSDHLHQVAYGDPARGIEPNFVLRQAMERSGRRKILELFTTMGAAAVSVGLFFSFGGLPEAWYQSIEGFLEGTIFAPAGPEVFSAMIFSGTVMGTTNNLLDKFVAPMFGYNRKTAHEVIQGIRRDINKNKIISQEQVFGVFVAANPGLDKVIEEAFGKSYFKLKPEQQNEALRQFGRNFQNSLLCRHTIHQLTLDINNRQIEADELVFAVLDQESGVPRLKCPQKIGEEKTELQEIAEEVELAIEGQDKSDAEKEREIEREIERKIETAEMQHNALQTIANDNVPSFAERFVPRRDESQSHVERHNLKPTTDRGSFAEKELERALEALNQDHKTRS